MTNINFQQNPASVMAYCHNPRAIDYDRSIRACVLMSIASIKLYNYFLTFNIYRLTFTALSSPCYCQCCRVDVSAANVVSIGDGRGSQRGEKVTEEEM